MPITNEHRVFVSSLQDRREEQERSGTYCRLSAGHRLAYKTGYLSAAEDILDVIHNYGYVLLDKNGNRVNPENISLAAGVWHKGN